MHAFVGRWRQVAFPLHFLGHEGYSMLLLNVGNYLSVEAVSRACNFPPIPLPAQTRRLGTRVPIYNTSFIICHRHFASSLNLMFICANVLLTKLLYIRYTTMMKYVSVMGNLTKVGLDRL